MIKSVENPYVKNLKSMLKSTADTKYTNVAELKGAARTLKAGLRTPAQIGLSRIASTEECESFEKSRGERAQFMDKFLAVAPFIFDAGAGQLGEEEGIQDEAIADFLIGYVNKGKDPATVDTELAFLCGASKANWSKVGEGFTAAVDALLNSAAQGLGLPDALVREAAAAVNSNDLKKVKQTTISEQQFQKMPDKVASSQKLLARLSALSYPALPRFEYELITSASIIAECCHTYLYINYGIRYFEKS